MKNRIYFLIILFLFLVPFSNAIFIRGGVKKINFEPNLEKTFSFSVGGAQLINVSFEGVLKNYTTVIDEAPNSGPRSVKVVLKLPESLPRPGRWSGFLVATQIIGAGGGIGTRVVMKEPIYVYVPYPGYYLIGSIVSDKVEINKTADVKVRLINKGKENLSSFRIIMNITDELNNTVKSIDKVFNEEILSTKRLDVPFKIKTKGWEPGLYKIRAVVKYSNKTLKLKGSLTIGNMDAFLAGFKPKLLWKDEINKVNLAIGVQWKKPRPVFAEVYLDNKFIEKSPTEQVGNFEVKQFTVFIDTKGFEAGNHTLTVKMYYMGKSKSEDRNVEIKERTEEPVQKEQPNENNMKLMIFTVLSIVVVIAAVSLLIYYLYKK